MRTAVMLLSILLSTTLLFVSFSIGASYESAQRKMARGMAGSATISVTAVAGGMKAEALLKLPSIRASVGMVEASALYHENGYYETIDLIAAWKHPPRELSGGQQHVSIARALIGSPEILFADEPTGNLDSRIGAEIMGLLREINQSIGQTIIMVTHSREAAKSSNRVITVQDGIIT